MSATETRIPFEQARALAAEVADLLRGSCTRLEVAGSIRRRRPDVGDLELVAIPRIEQTAAGLFGDQLVTVDQLDACVDALMAEGVFEHRLDKNGRPAYGPRYKRLVYRGVGLDLFVTSADAWGVIFLIRTGPHEFSQRLVTQRRLGGWMPNHLHVTRWPLAGPHHRRRDRHTRGGGRLSCTRTAMDQAIRPPRGPERADQVVAGQARRPSDARVIPNCRAQG